MLLFQGQGKTIYDGAKDFEKLSNAIESFCFIDELKKDIVNRPTDVGA